MSFEVFAGGKILPNFLGLTAAPVNSENDLLSILRILNLSNLKFLRMETKSFSETSAYLNYLTLLSAQENFMVDQWCLYLLNEKLLV